MYVGRYALARALIEAGWISGERFAAYLRQRRRQTLGRDRRIQHVVTLMLNNVYNTNMLTSISNTKKKEYREAIRRWNDEIERAPGRKKLEVAERGWDDIVRRFRS